MRASQACIVQRHKPQDFDFAAMKVIWLGNPFVPRDKRDRSDFSLQFAS